MAKRKKMLSDMNASYIQSLMRLIETQSKTTLVRWAIDYAQEYLLPLFEKYTEKSDLPADIRPYQALMAAQAWLEGQIKLPEAKAAILRCHQSARENENSAAAQAAARAIGQCASTIHSARHCIGLALYGALALAYDQLGDDAQWEDLETASAAECANMQAALKKIAIANETDPARITWHC
ncbi:MAG: hypothetical protein GX028_04350 [Clostridiaceae bacterium]|nr:hypothetical protein [Clostridiaceae bacterium]